MNQTHPLVDAYLDRLARLLDHAPVDTRAEVVAGVREHLDARLDDQATPAEVRAALAELGSPEQIAAEAFAAEPGIGAERSPIGELGRDRRWLPATVIGLGLVTLMVMVFLGLTTPHVIELVLALVIPPAWPVLIVLVLAARGWTATEKAWLIGCLPVAVLGMALVSGLAWGVNPSVGAWVSVASMLVAVVGCGAVIIGLGRRGLARAR